jgi:zona occludens toxin
MAINAYTGLMGSGKSFEVVASVIVPAIKAGRRVVTNIDGIKPEAIYDYLTNVKNCDADSLGQVIPVTNDDIHKLGFFPDETKPQQASVVQPGDMVCIDECWNFWGDSNKISPEHHQFFRMHRHFTSPQTGLTCDIVLMIQDLGSLNRKIRSIVELTSVTIKLKTLGAPTRYRIELYEGSKLNKKTKIDTFLKKYDQAIFPLYKSYAAGSGKEKPIDTRQNILTNPRLWLTLGFFLVLFGVGGWNTYRFFNPKQKPDDASKVAKVTSVAPGASGQVSTAQVPVTSAAPRQESFSETWRYVGQIRDKDNAWAVIQDSQGRLRLESPSVFQGNGMIAVGSVDGQRVTPWTGTQAQSQFTPAQKDNK